MVEEIIEEGEEAQTIEAEGGVDRDIEEGEAVTIEVVTGIMLVTINNIAMVKGSMRDGATEATRMVVGGRSRYEEQGGWGGDTRGRGDHSHRHSYNN